MRPLARWWSTLGSLVTMSDSPDSRALGIKLIETVLAELADADSNNDDYLAVIESWAEEFRIENYRASRSGDQIVIQFERPRTEVARDAHAAADRKTGVVAYDNRADVD